MKLMKIDKRNTNDKRTELQAENEVTGEAIARAARENPTTWYHSEIQAPKRTEVCYEVEDIFMPCTEKKVNKEIAHAQIHQPCKLPSLYLTISCILFSCINFKIDKKGGRSEDNLAAHVVTGCVVEVIPGKKNPHIPRFNFVNMVRHEI